MSKLRRAVAVMDTIFSLDVQQRRDTAPWRIDAARPSLEPEVLDVGLSTTQMHEDWRTPHDIRRMTERGTAAE